MFLHFLTTARTGSRQAIAPTRYLPKKENNKQKSLKARYVKNRLSMAD